MPSGAKKRKAARKKKENEAHNNQSTDNPQGSDELKSQDDKGTDGGEVNSPAANHQRPFNDGNEEAEERDSSAAQLSADVRSAQEVPRDVKNSEMVGEEQDGVADVAIEREMKSEDSYDSKNVSVERTDSSKELHYEDRNSIDTLNDEFVTENNSKNNQEAIVCDDLVKSVDSSSAEMTMFTERAPVKENDNSVVESSVVSSVIAVASGSDVNSSDAGSAVLENSMVPALAETDLAMKKDEDKGTEHIKDSETAECSDHQPLVASAPHVIRRTSWLNCCGLFELLSGSDK